MVIVVQNVFFKLQPNFQERKSLVQVVVRTGGHLCIFRILQVQVSAKIPLRLLVHY